MNYGLLYKVIVRLGWKSLPRTSTLVYYKNLLFNFYNIGPRGQCYKKFFPVIYGFSYKVIVRLGWNSLPRTNTIAYKNWLIADKKVL
jgi:hypothetical protein